MLALLAACLLQEPSPLGPLLDDKPSRPSVSIRAELWDPVLVGSGEFGAHDAAGKPSPGSRVRFNDEITAGDPDVAPPRLDVEIAYRSGAIRLHAWRARWSASFVPDGDLALGRSLLTAGTPVDARFDAEEYAVSVGFKMPDSSAFGWVGLRVARTRLALESAADSFHFQFGDPQIGGGLSIQRAIGCATFSLEAMFFTDIIASAGIDASARAGIGLGPMAVELGVAIAYEGIAVTPLFLHWTAAAPFASVTIRF